MARLFCIVLLAAVLAGAFAQTYHGVKVVRKPTEPENLSATGSNPECTVIYEVTLDLDYTTQCNDRGMLPPHGVDQTPCLDAVGDFSSAHNWQNWPFPNNAEKQNVAKSKSSVTALTESTGRYYTTPFTQPNKANQDAYPKGFQTDTIKEYHSVCVTIKNVGDRWIEIMAQTVQQDRSICVTDWNKPALADNPIQEACGSGEIYSCRPASNIEGVNDVNLRFYCKDSCEATDLDFMWRITSSHITNGNGMTNTNGDDDAEDWCMMRSGDDYPLSLLEPYPETYNAPKVFFGSTSSAISSHPSFPLLVLLVSLAFVLLFAF